MWVWVVVHEGEVFKLEVEDVVHIRVDEHLWQRTWLSCELQLHLLDMIEIDMRITKGVYEVASLEPCDLCHHLQEQRVGCDIEWHAEEDVRRALVELQGEATIGYIELE